MTLLGHILEATLVTFFFLLVMYGLLFEALENWRRARRDRRDIERLESILETWKKAA